MKIIKLTSYLLLVTLLNANGQKVFRSAPENGFEGRIKTLCDTITVFDTHEHLMDPSLLKEADFFDFTMLLQQNSYDDLVSAGMPDSVFNDLYGTRLSPSQKWKIIEPYWVRSFNTSYNRILLNVVKELYGIENLNSSSVTKLSSLMKARYGTEWFNHIIRDLCRIDHIVQSGPGVGDEFGYISYARGFGSWLTVRTKFTIDSISIAQVDPIFTLEDFVRSMRTDFETGIKEGMRVVKVNYAYQRTLFVENYSTEAARKVFRTLINGNEDTRITFRDAKPLQDYMTHKLMEMASEYGIPVAFHTGLLAGSGNYIQNSDPTLLTELFLKYRKIRFVLFHGSYPFGGELASLAKTFPNVYIDMNWTYAISSGYAQRYLTEWIETVPAFKIMAFGGDQRTAEITYGNLLVARELIGNVLIEKVRSGYFSEQEAIDIARMILHENAMEFYGFR